MMQVGSLVMHGRANGVRYAFSIAGEAYPMASSLAVSGSRGPGLAGCSVLGIDIAPSPFICDRSDARIG